MKRPSPIRWLFSILGISLGLFLPQGLVAQETDKTVTAADMPRIPHTPIEQALGTFKLAGGFELELVAAEPLVSDPVAACFDEHGRMFVAEMHGYPFSHEPTRLNPKGGGKKDAGIIRMLEDTDGDGKMDRSEVFAKDISWPTSLCCYNGGVFVIAPQYLYYFADRDGDGKAEVREEVLSGFSRDNVQAVTNGLLWDLNNRICFAAGRNPKSLKHRGKPLFAVGANDLSFDPKTEQFELMTGGLQFGHCIDDWGVRFVCSNSNHMQQVVYPQRYLKNNPGMSMSGVIRSIAADGASAQVFRRSPPEPWRIIRQKWRAAAKGYKLVVNDDGGWEFIPLDPSKKKGAVPTEYPVGFFTSATGITIYRGDAYPEKYRGNAFVGDVGGNLVHRKTVDSSGIVYSAKRADQGEEIVASSDNWFRPVNFVNAPDGTLYVLDMYRETIEHPHSIPEEIKRFLDLSSGDDRGRVYRLVAPNSKRRKPIDLGALSSEQLVAHLASANAWHRETAQRLLWERGPGDGAADVTSKARQLALSSGSPLGRLHALCLLGGWQRLDRELLVTLLRDEHPGVRTQALQWCETYFAGKPNDADARAVLDAMRGLVKDEHPRVRFQLALTLGEISHPESALLLGAMASPDWAGGSPELTNAWLLSAGVHASTLLERSLNDPMLRAADGTADLAERLAAMLGRQSNDAALKVLATGARANPPLDFPFHSRLLRGVSTGTKQRGKSLGSVLAKAPASLRTNVGKTFASAASVAADHRVATANRLSAIGLLAFADADVGIPALKKLLRPQEGAAIQLAAIEALAAIPDANAPAALLGAWKQFGPQQRRRAAAGMLKRASHVDALLDAIAKQAVQRSDLEQDAIQFLLKHPVKSLQSRSEQLLGGELKTDRAQVVAKFQDVLELDGSATRGREVFKRKCAVCHQVGDMGHKVAPDLASVKNKSASDLLIAILDPNREAQPNFNVYNVLTEDGETLSGMIVAETAASVTIRRAEAKDDVVLRSNIARLSATGVSLMPVGLEKDLRKQDLADVISFVKSITGKAPQGSK